MIGKIIFTDDFIVVNGINMHPVVILGCPSMSKNNIVMVPAKSGVFIKGKFIKSSHTLKANSNHKDVPNEKVTYIEEPISV